MRHTASGDHRTESTFLVLGQLDVRTNGVGWQPPPRKPRRLLAALLLEPGRYVSRDRLVDVVWDGEPPRSAQGAIQVYVSHLRRALPRVPIRWRGEGYLLDVDPVTVDLYRFRDLVRRADQLDPADQLGPLRQAVGLFRGAPLAGLGSDVLRWEVEPVIVEEMLTCWERLTDLELRFGPPADLVPRLERLTREHPLRERFYEQLMLAQHALGRPADASETYQRVRRLLRDELGVGPSRDLETAHQRVLAAVPPAATVVSRPDAPAADVRTGAGPNVLPRDLADFTGRSAELAGVAEIVRTGGTGPTVLSLTGMAGVGKTALAIRLAYRLRSRFDDGQLFVDLHGYTAEHEPVGTGEALFRLLRMIGVPASEISDDTDLSAAQWRAGLARRRMVLVFDNAVDVNQVLPLLPGDSPSLIVITSRTSLASLDDAHSLALDVFSEQEATELFTRIVGRDTVAAEPDAVRQVIRLCGHLPLAIRLAASRLGQRPTWPVREVAERLGNRRRLAELSVGNRSVDRAFDVSYRALSVAEQRMFRLLSLIPSPVFSVGAAAAVAELPVEVAQCLLETLLDRNLVEQRSRNRFQMHDLLHRYADGLSKAVDPVAVRVAGARRLQEQQQSYVDPQPSVPARSGSSWSAKSCVLSGPRRALP